MAGDKDDQGRLTRVASAIFLHTEHAIYAALGILLALTALAALIEAADLTWSAIRALGGPEKILEVIDRLLFLLMLIEILHTVRVSMRSGTLTCEPFLIVGLIASIRRVLVITLQSSEITHAKDWSPEKQALFQASMLELGVLGGLILVMVFAIFLLHRARDDGKPAGEESKEHAGA
ncbi:phosphate-starvation-inducible PsiE family protein [Methylobacterium sp. NEAU 140]|uniref:phosphate-starvation-inducible PsiE family protein n=1 Tax=Methylobacterium sp. NEAU 140 TaxID=3064945 RepID=UPI0027349143|nr:phosphate-starvation-inducible PsiE family protein [Methylobacterium sp. NEAU 140]MDP4024600.1 phosphate-starvation-inducible PsiE family protein [Methylobacterium sp. NEAU 140]